MSSSRNLHIVWGRQSRWRTMVSARMARESHVTAAVIHAVGTNHVPIHAHWRGCDGASVRCVGSRAGSRVTPTCRGHRAPIGPKVWWAEGLTLRAFRRTEAGTHLSSGTRHCIGCAPPSWRAELSRPGHAWIEVGRKWGCWRHAQHFFWSALRLNGASVRAMRLGALHGLTAHGLRSTSGGHRTA